MSSDAANAGANPRANRLWFLVLLLLAAGAVLAVAVVFFLDDSERPFPRLSEIERIDADVYDRKSKKDVTFEVPRSHWEAIFSAMLPARKDDHPLPWAGPGDLNLKLKSGHTFRIALFYVDKELGTGAFSAGATHESRIYYRGGNSSALEKAVADAFEASKVEHK